MIERHGLRPRLYATDIQVYGSCRPSAVANFQVCLSACVDVAWMLANHLQLNTGKTDLLWCATVHHCHQLPTAALRIGSDFVNKLKSVWDLRMYFDTNLSMRCHVQKTVASCFTILRQLCSIQCLVLMSVCQTLVIALVLSRLDYGNAVLVGLTRNLCSWLQSVLNAAARSIAGLRRSDHIIDTLTSFHWLRAPERMQFKLATIVYHLLNGTAPSYLAADLQHFPTCRQNDVCDPNWHTSWMFPSRNAQLLVIEFLPSRATHCHSSVVNWKHFCLHSPILLYFCCDLHFYLWS